MKNQNVVSVELSLASVPAFANESYRISVMVIQGRAYITKLGKLYYMSNEHPGSKIEVGFSIHETGRDYNDKKQKWNLWLTPLSPR